MDIKKEEEIMINRKEKKMITEKLIKVELTPTESKTLQDAVDIIDNLIAEMADENISRIFTEYDGFTADDLDEIARTLYSLKTANEAD